MVNSRSVAGVPSCRAAEAPSRPTAASAPRRPDGFRLGTVVRKRDLAVPAAGSGYLAGIGIGGGIAAAGDQLGLGGAFRSGPFSGNPIVVTKSTVHNSTDQHNNQMTRLVPASWGEVGPHRAREPEPA